MIKGYTLYKYGGIDHNTPVNHRNYLLLLSYQNIFYPTLGCVLDLATHLPTSLGVKNWI